MTAALMGQLKKKQFTDSCPHGNKEKGRADPAQPLLLHTNSQHTQLVSAQPPPLPVCRKPSLSLAVSSILNHICKYELKDIKTLKWPQLLPSHRPQQSSQAEQVLEPHLQQGHPGLRRVTATHELLQKPPTEEKEYYFMFIKMLI